MSAAAARAGADVRIPHVHGGPEVGLLEAQRILAIARGYKVRSSIGRRERAQTIALWEQAIAQATSLIHEEAQLEDAKRTAAATGQAVAWEPGVTEVCPDGVIRLTAEEFAREVDAAHAEALVEDVKRWSNRVLIRQHLGGATVETCDHCLSLIAPGDWCFGYGIGGGVAFACYKCGDLMMLGGR